MSISRILPVEILFKRDYVDVENGEGEVGAESDVLYPPAF